MMYDIYGNPAEIAEVKRTENLSLNLLSYSKFTNWNAVENGNRVPSYVADGGNYAAVFESSIYGGVIKVHIDSERISYASFVVHLIDRNGHITGTLGMTDGNYGDVYCVDNPYTEANPAKWTASGRIKIPADRRALIIVRTDFIAGSAVNTSDQRNSAKQALMNGYVSFSADNTGADAFSVYGLYNDVADLIDTAIDGWMTAWNGSNRRVPVIYTADQHSTLLKGKPLYDYLADKIEWANVSRIMNLGDNVFNFLKIENSRDATLEGRLKAFAELPKEKQLNVRGNHDVMTYNDPNNPNGWITKANRGWTDRYYQSANARTFDDAFDCVAYDPKYNVKYICLNGWEYEGTDGNGTQRVYRNTYQQMEAIIHEMERNDGYDIILVSHVPLFIDKDKTVTQTTDPVPNFGEFNWAVFEFGQHYAYELYNGLLNHTSGTVLDSDGVSHSFDFTDIDGRLLCAISGHTHCNGYYYVNGNGLLNLLSKNMYLESGAPVLDSLRFESEKANNLFNSLTVTFALVDKDAGNVKVWNVSAGKKSENELIGLNDWTAEFSAE